MTRLPNGRLVLNRPRTKNMKAPHEMPQPKTVPCKTCGNPTRMLGTCKCDVCWNIEARLEEYLRSPGGRARIAGLLRNAGYRVALLEQDTEERPAVASGVDRPRSDFT